ncbi:type I restriction endonuclease [Bacillus thuringiensis]|uniref:Restriction endonuclease subunit R n=1 Tax=Bacillus thuringiensis TaxID=1428 RepID=A0A9W3TA56_BACTU|nr:type I restriction endonuclease [Bacillus thuringiensis]AQY37369.1 restriction endonuclease subunit R [Bacillus thuringiensis]MDR4150594.1 type I restriction endonuclease subunit R [Bacillus thuringiensis]MEC3574065.1 type I restriction endonuclease [Bacillus thuringiensis]MED2019695.1 type I restriction endonuclease [Bacillus thuringiensis]MED2142236.1 type I restriction endonuclease [Bacillus thuringiensis]
MAIDATEKGFETNIEDSLIANGYMKRTLEGEASQLFKQYGLDVEELFAFLEDTQEKSLRILEKSYGADYKQKMLNRICDQLKKQGIMECLRHGIKDRGVTLKLIYNKPPTTMNQLMNDLYRKNRFTVSRQVFYSDKHNNSLDMVLFINGLPLIVMELKNPLTGQTVEDAMKQLKTDRDPREQLFKFNERVVVYFAVDPDEVFMATELKKEKTYFLPFNKGNNGGKGNPTVYDNYRTHYLWEEILAPDSLLDILFRFVFVKKDDILDSNGELIDERKMLIFPRYHQLDVVRKLEQDVQVKSVGQNYLIQHSAGSGKTNSISWLSHRLAKLHDEENNAVFSSVIVITDRRVLDKQLQDAVYQLEHKAGMVERINKDSNQLAQAITGETRIIITTLQKFPFIMEKVSDLDRKKYAVIIDEAHSSQGGKASTALTNILSDKTLEDAYEEDRVAEENLDNIDEQIIETIMKSGKQDNISFFAFTATPKPKTIEKFGTMGTDGKPHAFHEYTMRQAIEEGFILDVLSNYTTYKTFYKIAKRVDEDPVVSQKQATKKLAQYVSLHPHNVAQKTEIIIEHYRNFTQQKIGGRAKAMVVTASRLHAVRYKIAFDQYINKMGYEDLKTVVAFSGIVKDDAIPYSEQDMNGFSEKELPEKFNSDEYKVLLVAEKYQTGFDEPLLHTMYVDKPLSGIKAVQTLSRLNRTCPGKEDTFVLDFVNDIEDIKDSFQPYYESTGLEEVTDPNILYDLQAELEPYQIFTEKEVQVVNELEIKGGFKKQTKAQTELNSWIDRGVDRFKNLEEEEKDAFKAAATKFVRTYAFILQIATFIDLDLHKLYIYLNYLLRKLPRSSKDKDIYMADDVALEYYRNQKVFEGGIELEQTGGVDLKPTSHGAGGVVEDEKVRLSSILDKLNDRFGTEFTETDFLSRDQVKEDMLNSEDIQQKAKNNTKDNFKFAFEKSFINFVIDRMSSNEKFFMKILENEEFKNFIMEDMMNEVYLEVNG